MAVLINISEVSSLVILQQELQLLARKEYAALYSTKRKAKTVGYLAILKARNMHQERDAIVAWQTVDDTINLLCVIPVIGDEFVRFTRGVYVKQIVCLVDKYLVPHLLAVVVDKDVAHYGIYPPFEVCAGGIFLHISQSLQ